MQISNHRNYQLKKKIALIMLGAGSFESGFPDIKTLIWENNHSFPTEVAGFLPPEPKIYELYTRLQAIYQGGLALRLTAKGNAVTHGSKKEFQALACELEYRFQALLNSDSFRPIERKLYQTFNRTDPVQIIVQTEDAKVQRIPWHFCRFLDDYPHAEISFGKLASDKRVKPLPTRTRMRVLAILGNSCHIDVEADRQVLENLPEIEVEFLVEPTREKLNEYFWDPQGWDILTFSGHSDSGDRSGLIYINETDALTIGDLNNALKRGIENGLKLAIFNSCRGLGLAYQLSELQIPQVIVMRELVPDKIAQEFIKRFFQAFSEGNSFHIAMRQAREFLQGFEGDFPGASWLPAMFQVLGGEF